MYVFGWDSREKGGVRREKLNICCYLASGYETMVDVEREGGLTQRHIKKNGPQIGFQSTISILKKHRW